MQKSREKLNQEEAIKRIKFVIKEFNYSIIPPFKYKGDRNTDVTLFCQKHNYRWNISFHSLNKLYNKQLSCYKGCKYCRKLYTKEKCAEVALKFKTRSEFASEYKEFYFAALRNKWLDEICSHMTVVGNRYFRCIYSYEINFSNIKYVYVGLTENLEARDLIHSKRGSVYDFCKKNSLEKPKIKKLTEYLPKEEASKLEGAYLLKYIEKGWIPINKVHTGGLGGHLKFDGYTYDECLKIGQTYKTRSEWKQKDYSSYYIASKFNWIDTIKPPKKTYGNKNIKYWTKEQCILEARKYKSLNEFRKNSNVAYGNSK